MPLSGSLLRSRQMVLPILAVHALVVARRVELTNTSAIKEELAALQISLLSRQFIEAHQSHLDNSMTRSHPDTLVVKNIEHIVCCPYSTIKQLVLARCHIVSNSRLYQLCNVKRLVREVPIARPLLSVIPRMKRVMDREICLQVSIRFLSRADFVNNAVAKTFEARILLGGQDVGRALKYLIDLCIVIGLPRLERQVAYLSLTTHYLSGIFEVTHLTRIRHFLESITNSCVPHHVESLLPKLVLHLHVSKRNLLYLTICKSINAKC